VEELLAHPAVQAALAPFLSALVAAGLLRRSRFLGLAAAVAFGVVILLTVGYSFESLTAVRKMILIGFAGFLAMAALEWRGAQATPAIRLGLAAAAGGAAIWMLWRILQQQEPVHAVLRGAGAVVYIGALLGFSIRRGGSAIESAATAMVLGLAAGGLGVLAASALLAQVGIAVAAGSGQRAPAGWALVVPGALISGSLGLLAVFTGSLPWFCLLPTLAIPWAARLVQQDRHPPWLAAVLCALAALVPMLLAVGLAWLTAATS